MARSDLQSREVRLVSLFRDTTILKLIEETR